MEKISGILPSSSRIQSVDLSDTPGRRPGAPDYTKKRVSADTFSVSPMAKWKSKDMQKAGLVGKVTDTFFHNRIGQGFAAGPEKTDSAGNQATASAEVAPQREIIIIPVEVPVFDDDLDDLDLSSGSNYDAEAPGSVYDGSGQSVADPYAETEVSGKSYDPSYDDSSDKANYQPLDTYA